MNNEPVAWVREDDLKKIRHRHPSISRDKILVDDIPLYTHPAKTDKAELDTRSYMLGYADGKEVKTLTDEEIDTIVRDFFGEVNSFYDFRLVIRRCIRKAQEK